MYTINQTNFQFKNQTGFYKGKVRDVYFLGDQMLVIASDRISAFDVILPEPIPCKGQVLNQIAAHFLRETATLVPNWLHATPDPNVSVGLYCEPFQVEVVVRTYLCGHAWRVYKSGERLISGVKMPDGMKENDAFPQAIITPSTKAHAGHDEDISAKEILSQGLVSAEDWEIITDYALKLFAKGTEMAALQGLILADTKYEFGKKDDKIYLIDEIHTPDSSRYFYKEGYEERQEKGEAQKQLSKEFVREWLFERGFQGKEGQSVPAMTPEFVSQITERYIELYEKLSGKNFEKPTDEDILTRMKKNLSDFF
ncbi:MAG: phosphoribosylaminoimidazolesuccinocarboxamide synthase [Verrucomicrobia bacterium]|nr:phosphoribosylaminoimidazolesuccinocarboxamide synthase [Cytophagales bacterium]